jgi:hypothetical protein
MARPGPGAAIYRVIMTAKDTENGRAGVTGITKSSRNNRKTGKNPGDSKTLRKKPPVRKETNLIRESATVPEQPTDHFAANSGSRARAADCGIARSGSHVFFSLLHIVEFGKEPGGIDRFDEVTVKTGLLRAGPVFIPAPAGLRKDNEVVTTRSVAQSATDFLTAHPRQSDVEEHDIGGERVD